jgi:voltage-gated potassium channel
MRDSQRRELQERLSDWLDLPLAALALVALGLLVVEFTVDLTAAWAERVSQVQTLIWAIFLVAFGVEFTLAPSKATYLRRNWLAVVSVALPALRSVRILRVARALRSLSLLRVITTLNRGSRALAHVVQRGQLGYVLLLTVLVTMTAAAAVYYLEHDNPAAVVRTSGEAVWWAATIVTTINSPLEAVTFEGRVIGLLLRLFAVTVTGYLTAILAVFLIGRPPIDESAGSGNGSANDLDRVKGTYAESTLATEVRALRRDVGALRATLARDHRRSVSAGDAGSATAGR